MVNRKAQQLWINVTVVVAIGHGRVVARTDTSPANPETNLGRMIELVKQVLADLRRQLVEHVTGSLGERRADP